VLLEGERLIPVIPVKRIPICCDGAARHNVANALGATALAFALGIAPEAIAKGLASMSAEDNPGRANLYRVGGVTVLLDFAHNPHGLTALIDMAAHIPARRRVLVIGQAGDRSDADIRGLAAAAAPLRFDRILIKRADRHRRGRASGEVAAILKQAFREQGYRSGQLSVLASETGALRAALRWAGEGDLVVFLAHEDKEAARRLLAARQREAG